MSIKYFSSGGFLSGEQFKELFKQKLIVDARAGGLVIGRSHDDGSVIMIRQKHPEFNFVYASNLEGGEYIISKKAYFKYKERIEEINAYKWTGDRVDLYDICKCNILLTKNEPFDKILLIDHQVQFIVNKKATSRFLYEIDCINKCIR